MSLQNILAKIEEARILREEREILYQKLGAVESEIYQELIAEGLIYLNHYMINFTNELQKFFNYNNTYYSSNILDFLLPDLFQKCTIDSLYFEVYCIKSKSEMVVFRRNELVFVKCNSLSETEYNKLMVHPDKEKLIQFLITDKENGDIAKLILSN